MRAHPMNKPHIAKEIPLKIRVETERGVLTAMPVLTLRHPIGLKEILPFFRGNKSQDYREMVTFRHGLWFDDSPSPLPTMVEMSVVLDYTVRCCSIADVSIASIQVTGISDGYHRQDTKVLSLGFEML